MKFLSHVLALVHDRIQKFEIEDIGPKGHLKVKEIKGYRIGPKTYGNKVEEIIQKQAGDKPGNEYFLFIWGNRFRWEIPLKKDKLPNSEDLAYTFHSATIPFHESAVYSSIEEAVEKIGISPIEEPNDETTDSKPVTGKKSKKPKEKNNSEDETIIDEN